MLVTFKPIIIPGNRRSDGTWAVYIRVTFKGVCRRLPTNLAAAPSDLTRAGRIKSADLLERAGVLVARMRGAIQDLTVFELEAWDVDRVVGRIRDRLGAEGFRLDLFVWADRYLAGKGASTRRTYDQALAALERYLGRRELDVNAVTRSMLLDFVDYINAEPKMHKGRAGDAATATGKEKAPGAAAARHIQKLGHIYRAAKDRYNDEDSGRILIPRSPFDSVRVPVPRSAGGQRSIGRDAMQRAILARTDDPRERIALDAFVLSFALMGANLADLWAAAPVPDGGLWIYHRQKTKTRRVDGAEMRVTVPSAAAPFVARLGAPMRQIRGVWLPALRQLATTKDICTAKINALLRRWAEREGLPGFTFYAARHTWATIARAHGVEKATVDECLGHVGDFALTDIYAERSWDQINAANAKVLALFRWPSQD
ncbi:MAG: hypothetical protein IJ654_10505 [Bacteroidales bacterium]|nr:hypothetical protein [Bacteroidales bacterium]